MKVETGIVELKWLDLGALIFVTLARELSITIDITINEKGGCGFQIENDDDLAVLDMKKQYVGIDIFKFVFAICVVAIHSSVFYSVEVLKNCVYPLLFNAAVPFFFVVSGFFVSEKIKKNELNIKKYEYRLFEKLCFFEPISILIFICIQLYIHTPIGSIILDTLKRVLFYPFGALWYIQALMFAVIPLGMFWKRDRYIEPLVIGVLLYTFALLSNNYYFIAENTGISGVIDKYMDMFVSPRNGLFVAPLFLSVGGVFSKYNKRFTIRKTIPVLFTSVILCVIEILTLNGKNRIDSSSLYVSYLMLIPAYFLISLSDGWGKLVSPSVSKKLRNLSTSIYLVHSPIIMCIRYGSEFIGMPVNGVPLFIFSLVAITVVLWLLNRIKNKKVVQLLT